MLSIPRYGLYSFSPLNTAGTGNEYFGLTINWEVTSSIRGNAIKMSIRFKYFIYGRYNNRTQTEPFQVSVFIYAAKIIKLKLQIIYNQYLNNSYKMLIKRKLPEKYELI